MLQILKDDPERWIVAFAIGRGLRQGEQWCLHIEDVHVDGDDPHVLVRFGSWDAKKKRYRPPKGRAGEKKSRRVPLFGLGLEAATEWLKLLPTYAPDNPLGLMYPTPAVKKAGQDGQRDYPGGARRMGKAPASWSKVVASLMCRDSDASPGGTCSATRARRPWSQAGGVGAGAWRTCAWCSGTLR